MLDIPGYVQILEGSYIEKSKGKKIEIELNNLKLIKPHLDARSCKKRFNLKSDK